METIQHIVNEKVQQLIASGSIEKRIQEGVENAIDSAIKKQFESYGDVSKQIQDVIKTGLKINPSDIPFQSYNEQMLVAVKTKLGNMFAGAASERFLSEIDKLLDPAPASMSIHDLINQICRFLREESYSNKDDWNDCADITVERGSGCMSDTFGLKIKTGVAGYGSKSIHLHLSSRKEGDHTIRINHEFEYNPTCFNDVEALIFKLYAAGTIITGVADYDEYEIDRSIKTDSEEWE